MMPVDIKPSIYIDFNKKHNNERPKLKVADNVRISKFKKTFAKGYVPNWSEKVSVIKKVKKTNKKEFKGEKVIKRKDNKLYVKWKGYNSSVNSWFVNNDMSEYFPEPKSFGGSVKVELDLSNYATKVDLKIAAGVDTSKFGRKAGLASLKSEVDKLDIDKLEKVPPCLNSLKSKVDKLDVDKLVPVPVDLSKLSDVVKNDFFKKDV